MTDSLHVYHSETCCVCHLEGSGAELVELVAAVAAEVAALREPLVDALFARAYLVEGVCHLAREHVGQQPAPQDVEEGYDGGAHLTPRARPAGEWMGGVSRNDSVACSNIVYVCM